MTLTCMDFWRLAGDEREVPFPTWGPMRGDAQRLPIWFLLQCGRPTTWIPSQHTGAALAVARAWGMRSIGLTAPLAIMARAERLKRTHAEFDPERLLAEIELAGLHLVADQITEELQHAPA